MRVGAVMDGLCMGTLWWTEVCRDEIYKVYSYAFARKGTFSRRCYITNSTVTNSDIHSTFSKMLNAITRQTTSFTSSSIWFGDFLSWKKVRCISWRRMSKPVTTVWVSIPHSLSLPPPSLSLSLPPLSPPSPVLPEHINALFPGHLFPGCVIPHPTHHKLQILWPLCCRKSVYMNMIHNYLFFANNYTYVIGS